MKAIINGKRYDTELAILIGRAGGGNGPSDFHWWEAGLYKTPRSGTYFLAGKGGPMTRFAHSTGQSSWSGGSKIIPLEPEDALTWAEDNLKTGLVEAAFGNMIKDA